MARSVRKRLAFAGATVTTVGAVATLVAGFTFGLFSSSESSGANTFTAGTVTVGLGTGTTTTCTITSLMPGDSSTGYTSSGSKADTQCAYSVEYTGSANAWLGVDMTVADGTSALFGSGSSQGIQFLLKDGTPTTYVSSDATDTGNTGFTSYTQEGGTSAALPATGASNLLVSTTPAATGTQVQFTLDYGMPLDTGNAFNLTPASSVTVTLTFHAVQASNNVLPADCLAGQQCNAGGDGSAFAWS